MPTMYTPGVIDGMSHVRTVQKCTGDDVQLVTGSGQRDWSF